MVELLRRHGANERPPFAFDQVTKTMDRLVIREFHKEWHATALATKSKLRILGTQTVPTDSSMIMAWNPGAQHTIEGKVAIIVDGKKYLFLGDPVNPLAFTVDRESGYVYQRGRGIVTYPDGKRIQLEK
jgi:hypothetical protein